MSTSRARDPPRAIGRAAPVEFAVFDLHRHHARHSVDMPQQHNRRSRTGLANRVAGIVDIAAQAKRAHLPDKIVGHRALLAGDAGDAQGLFEKSNGVEVWSSHDILTVVTPLISTITRVTATLRSLSY